MLKRTTSTTVAALLLYASASPAFASAPINTRGTASVAESASVQVVNDAPMQTLLLTGAIAPTGVTFTLAGQDAGSASLGLPGFVSGGGEELSVNGSGLITGTTINGQALSVSVGGSFDGVSGDSNTGANGGVPMVIAQYN